MLDVLRRTQGLKDKPVSRVVFNAITKGAVTEAMKHPRDIDAPLVDAYLARRALDYLVGFTLSPVLWRKLPGSRSAGRVQSVALRLVCDREAEIERFKPQEYWSVRGDADRKAEAVRGPALRRRRQEDRQAGHRQRCRGGNAAKGYRSRQLPRRERREEADQAQSLSALHHLDPAAGRLQPRLVFAPARTMQIAQRLYEDGAHHLYADRRRADGAGRHRSGPPRHRQGIRRQLSAGKAAHLFRPRQRTRRKRTRPSARPTCPCIRMRLAPMPIRRSSTA